MNGPLPPGAAASGRDWPRGPLGVIALTGAALGAVAAGIVILTLVPGSGTALSAVWPWGFEASTPVFVVGLAMAYSTFPSRLGRPWWRQMLSGRDDLRDMVTWLPTTARWIVGAALVLGVVTAVASISAPEEHPVTAQGRYYADEGKRTELSATQYDAALRTKARGSASTALVFTTVGAALIVASARRRSHLAVEALP